MARTGEFKPLTSGSSYEEDLGRLNLALLATVCLCWWWACDMVKKTYNYLCCCLYWIQRLVRSSGRSRLVQWKLPLPMPAQFSATSRCSSCASAFCLLCVCISVPRLLFTKQENSLLNCLYRLFWNHRDVTSTGLWIQKHSSKQQTLRQPTRAPFDRYNSPVYTQQLRLPDQCPFH